MLHGLTTLETGCYYGIYSVANRIFIVAIEIMSDAREQYIELELILVTMETDFHGFIFYITRFNCTCNCTIVHVP